MNKHLLRSVLLLLVIGSTHYLSAQQRPNPVVSHAMRDLHQWQMKQLPANSVLSRFEPRYEIAIGQPRRLPDLTLPSWIPPASNMASPMEVAMLNAGSKDLHRPMAGNSYALKPLTLRMVVQREKGW